MSDAKILKGLRRIIKKESLTQKEAEEIMREIMSGKATHTQLGAFLTALSMKGESIQEITGFAKIMRYFSNQINPNIKGELLDTCGTGGDKIKTFNISTLTALVVAGCGVYVAKHGNRAVTSNCGSADLLEGLGVKIDLPPEKVKICIEKAGIGFMFAPLFHPAMKYAMPTRRELKIRTVFNILGPLTNPANAQCHTLGVFQKDLLPIMAKVLGNLGGDHIFTVHNSFGIDELAPVGINYISEYYNGNLQTYALTNEDFNLPNCSIEDLLAGTLEDNLKIAINILRGQIKDSKYYTVLMNASLALKSANVASDFGEGISIAEESIESGKAFQKLEKLIEISEGPKEKLKCLC
ncbi:MAG: anthranilate phosphoribosyltransferase [Candidatus Lokiarchaeota archaeon]|nr:anthranilate phosphoribosyltransferase [Candidatus Lokiarchaeota archaeon]